MKARLAILGTCLALVLSGCLSPSPDDDDDPKWPEIEPPQPQGNYLVVREHGLQLEGSGPYTLTFRQVANICEGFELVSELRIRLYGDQGDIHDWHQEIDWASDKTPGTQFAIELPRNGTFRLLAGNTCVDLYGPAWTPNANVTLWAASDNNQGIEGELDFPVGMAYGCVVQGCSGPTTDLPGEEPGLAIVKTWNVPVDFVADFVRINPPYIGHLRVSTADDRELGYVQAIDDSWLEIRGQPDGVLPPQVKLEVQQAPYYGAASFQLWGYYLNPDGFREAGMVPPNPDLYAEDLKVTVVPPG